MENKGENPDPALYERTNQYRVLIMLYNNQSLYGGVLRWRDRHVFSSRGAFYHIVARGNERKNIYYDEYDKKKFMDILLQSKERYEVKIHAYVLMDNYYHIFLEAPNEN